MNEKPLVKYALDYARRGWYVFPLAPLTKTPMPGSRGLLDASNDAETIKRWWSAEPRANIGVNCGKSGLVVLDIDTKEGRVGANSLIEIVDDSFELLETVIATTWSGGRHYFYHGSCASSASKLGRDLDIRGEGGYIVLAPSVINENGKTGSYKWHKTGEKQEFAEFPDRFRPAERGPMQITEELTAIIGNRNDTLFRIGSKLRRSGFSAEEIFAALQACNKKRCRPPLPDEEILKMAENIGKRYAPHDEIVQKTDNATTPKGFGFRTSSQIIERATELQDWLVENLVGPNAICLFSAEPGAGKSTLMRSLAQAVAEGDKFLSRQCKKGLVAWIGMEESDRDLASSIEDLDMVENDNVLYAAQGDIPPMVGDRWKMLEEFIREQKPSLVIIDTLAKFADLGDINHYSEVGRGLQPFFALRERYPVAFVLIHHTNAAGNPLGSRRIKGDVDIAIDMTIAEGGGRIVSTSKTRGSAIPIEPTLLTFDASTKRVFSEEPKWMDDKRVCEQNVLRYLATVENATRKTLAVKAGRSGSVAGAAVDSLLAAGLLSTIGSGKKGDPKLYSLVKPPSLQGSFLRLSCDDQQSQESLTQSHAVSSIYQESQESQESQAIDVPPLPTFPDPRNEGRRSHLQLVRSGSELLDYAVGQLGEIA